ncbi:hypothetical protein [Erwinia sp. SLM-02]|uniref:hypothetical protein n=1 Tax=Erwinia sp. SLM-02 TaxID=3020057 RepID=UPI0028D616D6|nr:hypothetical protein [uncultured Erwinia sp.]
MATISQKAARDLLGSPENFRGGVFVTRNGTAELFIQTAAEREAELAEREADKQINAMLRLVGLSKQEFARNESLSAEELLAERQRLRQLKGA